MKRTQICLTEKQHAYFIAKAKEIGISLAELIRRVLDNNIDDDKNK